MYYDIALLDGPVGKGEDVVTKIKARPLGRPYTWSNGMATNGGVLIVYEAEDGSIYVQEIEWETDVCPATETNPRTYYCYETFPSLAAARASWRGWLIDYALGNDNR